MNPIQAGSLMDRAFIEREIARFKASERRRDMLLGERYFLGRQDILRRRRQAIGEGGRLVDVPNLPNNRVVDNLYRKMVIQKANYLLGRPLTFRTDDAAFAGALRGALGRGFHRLMKNVARDALNEGLAWLYPTYGADGGLVFRKFKAHEVIPGWRDEAHTALDYAIRVYPALVRASGEERVVEKVELYAADGVRYFTLTDSGTLVPEPPFHESYFTVDGGQAFNWSRLPLIPFRRDPEELPLIRGVKSLQDGLNAMLSAFQNGMEEDPRNTILILINYDGENLGEFRRNLAQYGVVKVRTVDGVPGDLRSLQIEVNAENYKAILEVFKKALIENAMGFDAKDERLTGTPNQMNIQSMYSDVDLDASDMETEFQAALEELMWFVRCHLYNTGAGDFADAPLEIIFNRDLPMVEASVIESIKNSVGLLSDETLIAQHPWVDDPQEELRRLERQRARKGEAQTWGGVEIRACPKSLDRRGGCAYDKARQGNWRSSAHRW